MTYSNIAIIFITSILVLGCSSKLSHKSEDTSKVNNIREEVYKVASTSDSLYNKKKVNNSKKNIELDLNGNIVIGLLLPMSDNTVNYQDNLGKSLLNAAQLALHTAQISNFSLAVIDISADDFSAKDAVNEAKQKNVQLFIGPIFSKDTKKIAPFASKAAISLLSLSNDSSLIDNGAMILGLSPEQQSESVVKFAIDNGYKEFYLLLPENDYGKLIFMSISKLINSDKSSLVIKSEFYKDNNKSLKNATANIINSLKISKTEKKSLFLAESGDNLKKIMLQIEDSEIDYNSIKLLGTNIWHNKDIFDISHINHAWFASTYSEYYENFSVAFASQYGYKPQYLESLMYDAIGIAAVLSKKDYSFDTITNNRGYSGINGIFKFDKKGISRYNMAIYEISDNHFKIIKSASILNSANKAL